MLFVLAGIVSCRNESVRLDGEWKGYVSISGREKGIFVRFSYIDKLRGTIDIPEQGGSNLPLSGISYKYPVLRFELESDPNTVIFESKVEKGKIAGKATQGSASGKFVLERVDELLAQKAKRFTEEQAYIEAKNGKISGALLVPDEGGSFPVLLVVTDMGPTDRDGNTMFSKTKSGALKLLAESLATVGVASLRYDRRGIGESSLAIGKMTELRFDDYVSDAIGFIDMLSRDSRFFMIGVLTQGDGSVVGMRACAAEKADFLIVIASPSRPQGVVLLDQYKVVLDADAFSKAKSVIENLLAGIAVENVDRKIAQFFPASMQPFFISWFPVNPVTEMAKLGKPVLVMNGTADPFATVFDGQELVKAGSRAAFRAITGMNHGLMVKASDTEEGPGVLSAELVQNIFRFIADASVSRANTGS